MNKFDELLAKLKEIDSIQKNCWEENIPENIWDTYFANYKEVAHGLNIDTHRWYEISTTVLEIFGRFLGIRHVSNLFSESMSYEDCFVEMEFFEMEEFNTISYRPKECINAGESK